MPQKRYPADCTIVLCGLRQNADDEDVIQFLESENLSKNVELVSKTKADRTSAERKLVYLNVKSANIARDLIKKLNDKRSEEIGSSINQFYLQAVFKRDLSSVSWSKYTPKTKTCDGEVVERRKTQCIVRSTGKITVARACFQGEWSLLKIGDQLRIEIQQEYGSEEWHAIGAVKIQPQVTEATTQMKQEQKQELQSSPEDLEGRARSYRIQRLLMELVPKVLAFVFKQTWHKNKGQPWTAESGPSLYAMMDSREAIRTLGKHGILKIETGKVDSWDITILAKLLVDDPGLLQRSPAATAVQNLRKIRNDFVHSLSSESKLSAEGFSGKWKDVTVQLDKLIEMIGDEGKNLYKKECERIQKEALDENRAKELESELDDVKAGLNAIKDDIGALHEEQTKVLEKLSNVVTRSEVGRLLATREPVTKEPPSDIITMTNGKRFKLFQTRRLGNGAMGTVFEARDLDEDQLAAVKVCDEAANHRGSREAVNLERVIHDNVVRFLGYSEGTKPGQLVIAMELVVGVTYEQHLKEQCPLAWKAACKDMLQIAAGMAAVHAQGIVHRDLKPANIMRKHCGRLVIVDFGLSKQLSAGTTVTLNGGGVGSQVYMSPEAIMGATGRVNACSDVFTIGVIFYEALTGYLPFGSGERRSKSADNMSLFEQGLYSNAIVKSPPLPINSHGEEALKREVPALIETLVCTRVLAKKQEDRPADGAALLTELEDTLEAAEAAADDAAAAQAGQAMSESAAAFWKGVSGGELSTPWGVLESALVAQFPAVTSLALRAIQDELDNDHNGCVTAEEFQAFVGVRPLDEAVTPYIERAAAASTRIKASAAASGGKAGGEADSGGGEEAEPAGVHFTLAKVERVMYVSAGKLFGSSRKPGLLQLHRGALVLSKPRNGKERDRFDLLAANVTVEPSARDKKGMDVMAVRRKPATYIFESEATCAAWVAAVRRTKEWLQS